MRKPTHPGELLEESLSPLGLPMKSIAGKIGISRNHLYRIFNGHKVTLEAARSIEKAYKISAELLLNMQLKYDLWELKNVRHKN